MDTSFKGKERKWKKMWKEKNVHQFVVEKYCTEKFNLNKKLFKAIKIIKKIHKIVDCKV